MKLISPLIPEDEPLNNRQQKPENNQGNNTDVDAETGEVPPGMGNPNGRGKSGKKQKQNQGNQGQDNQNNQGSAGGNQQNDQSSGNGQSNSPTSGNSQGQGKDDSQNQGAGQGGGQASQQSCDAGNNSSSGPTKGGSGQANASELTKEIETIKQKIHDLIPLAWKHGCIAFWPEFDLLYEYYPFQTRVYRLWLEVKSRLRRNADA